ncbi:MAG: hypothetical protein KAQ98_13235 [Bacteriovoracaceae bacterium]|nr:hypothetical protein [Bacteriovoracaceae bacterium]
MSIVITKRDYELLRFFNDFKFGKITTLSELLFVDKLDKFNLARRRLKKLFDNDLVQRCRCFESGQYVYWLSLEGINYLKSKGIKTYKLLNKLSWGTWEHDDFIQTVMIEFKKNGIERFLSERQLLNNSKLDFNIVPDLGVSISDDYMVAVEVEKNRKTKRRIRRKLEKLNSAKIFKIVLYITFDRNIADNVESSYACLSDPSFHLITADRNILLNNSEKIISSIIKLSEGDSKI